MQKYVKFVFYKYSVFIICFLFYVMYIYDYIHYYKNLLNNLLTDKQRNVINKNYYLFN